MRGSLECTLKVYYKWVVDGLKNLLLRLDMFNLFKSDDFALFQALQSDWFSLSRFALMFYKPYSTKGACT